jgi:hypothetical protein
MLALGCIGVAMLAAAGLTLLLDGPLSGVFAALTIVAAYLFIVAGLSPNRPTSHVLIRLYDTDDVASDRSGDT